MRCQRVLGARAVLAHVEDRIWIPLAIRLERRRDGVSSHRVEKGLQRDDAVVAYPGVAIEANHPGQVGALVPELGAMTDLLEQVGEKSGRVEALARCRNAELRFGQVPGQHPRVVAMALDGAGVARDPMLLQARGTLADGAGEKDARHRRAFPERGLGREPALAE